MPNWKQLLALLLIAGSALLWMTRDDGGDRLATIPEPLHGVWQTRDPSFADRFVQFEAAQITFGVGFEGLPRQHGVLWMESEPKSDETYFTVRYLEDDGAESELKLAYSPRRDEVRLISRPHVRWQRREAILAEDAEAKRRAEEAAQTEPGDPLGEDFDAAFAGPIWTPDPDAEEVEQPGEEGESSTTELDGR